MRRRRRRRHRHRRPEPLGPVGNGVVGRPAGDRTRRAAAPDEAADPDRILTVDDLFDRARTAIDEADGVEIDYDNDFDFPATIVIDNLIDAIDDEVTYVVTDFEVVS
ncbi:MAG: DUF6174 domain-containing protein [Acidimicrobiales bacterium]